MCVCVLLFFSDVKTFFNRLTIDESPKRRGEKNVMCTLVSVIETTSHKRKKQNKTYLHTLCE